MTVKFLDNTDRDDIEILINKEIAKKAQLIPSFAYSTKDCVDISKLYILPDGYLYAYSNGSEREMNIEMFDISKVMTGTRTNSSNIITADSQFNLIPIFIDVSKIESDITLVVTGARVNDMNAGASAGYFVRYAEFASADLALEQTAIRGGWVGADTGYYFTEETKTSFKVKIGYSDETTKIADYDSIRAVTFSTSNTTDLSTISIKARYTVSTTGWFNTGVRFIPTTDEVLSAVINEIGLPLYGTVDENNTITVSGNLPSGTYTMKYEDETGNATNIGSFIV